MTGQPSVKRRIKAAMELANVDFETLANRIATRGLGARTLRKLQDENDKREPRPFELDLIADACDVPRWFLAHGWNPPAAEGEPIEDRVASIERRLDAAAQAVEGADALGPAEIAALARTLASVPPPGKHNQSEP